MTTIIKSNGYSGSLAGLKSLSDYDLLPSKGLKGLYEFNEGGGLVLSDTSGNNNHGSIIQGSGMWASEGSGFSFQFNGTSIDLPFGEAYDLTFVVVCKPIFNSGDNSFRALVSNIASAGSGAALSYYSAAGGGTSLVYGTSTGLSTKTISPPDVAFDENWRMEVLSLGFDGNLNLSNMTNGVINTSVANGYIPSNSNICIGNNVTHGAILAVLPFNGKIAAIAVYDRKLQITPSITNPSGLSEFGKLKQFANNEILKGRNIIV